jgi:ABC-2 type transport system permease protein
MSRLGTQVRTEVTLVSRNGEQLLLTLGIPIMLLVFFSVVDVLPTGTDDPVDFLAPGVLALAVMSTAMVSLGIGTGFERSYHVLKRLGATPLGAAA